jgi:hypothetical protein
MKTKNIFIDKIGRALNKDEQKKSNFESKNKMEME